MRRLRPGSVADAASCATLIVGVALIVGAVLAIGVAAARLDCQRAAAARKAPDPFSWVFDGPTAADRLWLQFGGQP